MGQWCVREMFEVSAAESLMEGRVGVGIPCCFDGIRARRKAGVGLWMCWTAGESRLVREPTAFPWTKV